MAENNNKDYTPSVNTNGTSFYNIDNGTVLTLGYWNDLVNIRINPKLDNPTGNKVYDYEKYVSTALTIEKLAIILDGIQKSILPALETKSTTNVSVQVGTDGLISIGSDAGVPFVGIYKGLDPNTKKPSSYLVHKFMSSNYISDYNIQDGSYKLSEPKFVEFSTFITMMLEGFKALSKAYAHALRNETKWIDAAKYRMETAVAEKLGVEVRSAQKKYGSSRPSVSFDSPSSSTVPETQSIESLEDIDDIPF